MSLTSYRAAPPRVRGMLLEGGGGGGLAATYSSAACAAVPSALRVFTAEFGMGSGAWPLAMATRLVPVKAGACPRTPAEASVAGTGCHVSGSVFKARPRCCGSPLARGLCPARAGQGFAAARGRRLAEGYSAAASSASRAISTGQLRGLPRFHLRPIDVVVFHGSRARPGFEEGFPLRCVQRLSRPHLATRRCGWRHNRYTRGASLPVLSYWGERLASLEHPRQIGTELSHDVLNPAHVPL